MLDGLLLLIAIALISFAFYKWARANEDFFEKRNIKCSKPTFLFGNVGGVFLGKYDAAEYSDKMYSEFPTESYVTHEIN